MEPQKQKVVIGDFHIPFHSMPPRMKELVRESASQEVVVVEGDKIEKGPIQLPIGKMNKPLGKIPSKKD